MCKYLCTVYWFNDYMVWMLESDKIGSNPSSVNKNIVTQRKLLNFSSVDFLN